jgi:hypothetical protein
MHDHTGIAALAKFEVCDQKYTISQRPGKMKKEHHRIEENMTASFELLNC